MVNFGLHAGFGRDVIAEFAMEEAKPGDAIVVALEPSFLEQETETPPPSAGIDFFLSDHGLSFRRNPFFSLAPSRFPGCLSGNTRYNLFMAMKRIRRLKPYRYVVSDNLHDDGWMEVWEKRKLPFNDNRRPPVRLGKAGREFLLKIRTECERRRCRVVYQLPPRLDGAENARAANAALLLDILPIMPVVADPLLGVNPDPDEFADTPQHPLIAGAERASRSFGEAFANGRFWDEEALLLIIATDKTQR